MFISGVMGVNTSDSGKTTKCMATESYNGQTASAMKASITSIKKMATALSIGK